MIPSLAPKYILFCSQVWSITLPQHFIVTIVHLSGVETASYDAKCISVNICFNSKTIKMSPQLFLRIAKSINYPSKV